MKIVRLRDLVGTDRDVGRETFRSRRFLLASDGQGYSFHETVIQTGTELHMWYKNHVETVYCVAGEGELEDVATGEIHTIHDGMLYCLDDHDRHILRATTDLRLICVFTPALLGPELHDEDGSFALLTDESNIVAPHSEAGGHVVEQAEKVAARVTKSRRQSVRKPKRQSNQRSTGTARQTRENSRA